MWCEQPQTRLQLLLSERVQYDVDAASAGRSHHVPLERRVARVREVGVVELREALLEVLALLLRADRREHLGTDRCLYSHT